MQLVLVNPLVGSMFAAKVTFTGAGSTFCFSLISVYTVRLLRVPATTAASATVCPVRRLVVATRSTELISLATFDAIEVELLVCDEADVILAVCMNSPATIDSTRTVSIEATTSSLRLSPASSRRRRASIRRITARPSGRG